jgi:hypothetical protein
VPLFTSTTAPAVGGVTNSAVSGSPSGSESLARTSISIVVPGVDTESLRAVGLVLAGPVTTSTSEVAWHLSRGSRMMVAHTLMLCVPSGVSADVLSVSVRLCPSVTAGPSGSVTPLGTARASRRTLFPTSPTLLSWIVVVASEPRITVTVSGDALGASS